MINDLMEAKAQADLQAMSEMAARVLRAEEGKSKLERDLVSRNAQIAQLRAELARLRQDAEREEPPMRLTPFAAALIAALGAAAALAGVANALTGWMLRQTP